MKENLRGERIELDELADILIKKLTKEELSWLVQYWDEGDLVVMMYSHLIPKDTENYPELYEIKDVEA